MIATLNCSFEKARVAKAQSHRRMRLWVITALRNLEKQRRIWILANDLKVVACFQEKIVESSPASKKRLPLLIMASNY